jgi:hypothetical protein
MGCRRVIGLGIFDFGFQIFDVMALKPLIESEISNRKFSHRSGTVPDLHRTSPVRTARNVLDIRAAPATNAILLVQQEDYSRNASQRSRQIFATDSLFQLVDYSRRILKPFSVPQGQSEWSICPCRYHVHPVYTG